MLSVEPILDSDLPAVGAFLHQHHDPSRTAESWANLFRYPWEFGRPNNGFLLRDGDALAGVVGAIYSAQTIRSKSESFCNITSWVVLESHRSHSTRLLHACLAQSGYHFTNFSPLPIVETTLRFLKFTLLEKSYYVIPSRPNWSLHRVRAATPENLVGDHLQAFECHRTIPGLIHLSVDSNYVVLTNDRVKGLPAAEVLHAGNQTLLSDALPAIGSYLLARGKLFLKVETRFTTRKPAWSIERPLSVRKYYRSDHLQPGDVTSIYSERVLLL